MKPLKIYVACKYSGRGSKVCAELFNAGYAPFSPWWDRSLVLDNPDGDYNKDMFYAASMEWMKVSDVVYVISGAGDGGGVDKEIATAHYLGIPVFYDLVDLGYYRHLWDGK